MIREAQEVVLIVILGLLVATVYPGAMILRRPSTEQYADAMMFSIYVTLGIFLLLAHAATMAAMVITDVRDRTHLVLGVGIFAVFGVTLLAVTPRRSPVVVQKETAS